MGISAPGGSPRPSPINASDLQVGQIFTVSQLCSITDNAGRDLELFSGDEIEIRSVDGVSFGVRVNNVDISTRVPFSEAGYIIAVLAE